MTGASYPLNPIASSIPPSTAFPPKAAVLNHFVTGEAGGRRETQVTSAMRWRVVTALLLVAIITDSTATSTTTDSWGTGRVQAATNESSTTVKPGKNGYGTVTYGSASCDSSDSSEAAANRLALEEAEALHPNLRLRLGIGI